MSSSASSSASGSASGSTSTLAPSPSGPLAPGSLSGVTIVLNPGHNGGNAGAARDVAVPIDAGGFTKPCDTTGTETGDGYPEHAFTFDVATRTAALLQAAGAVVVLTRPDDSGVGPCLDQRARIANDAAPAAVVHIHADGGPPDGTGFHVIGPALAPDGANAAILDPSSRLAVTLRDQFALTTGEPFASYIGEAGLDVRSDLAGMNLSTAPAVFIECGNMRNADEAARMEDPQWRALAAEGIARGIGAFVAAGG
jgi:N-acetylmuramoyl-L-alanine amidase